MKHSNSNTGIEFNEEYSGERIYSPETSKIIGWVINSSGGLIKNEKQANYVLIGFVVFAVSVSLFVISFSGGESKKNTFSSDSSINVNQFAPEI